MKSICLIVPYIGKLNDFLSYGLKQQKQMKQLISICLLMMKILSILISQPAMYQ